MKVKAAETLYKGISFYLEEHPDLLNDLLKVRCRYGGVGVGAVRCVWCGCSGGGVPCVGALKHRS